MRKFLVLFMCFMMLVSTTAFAAEQAFTMTNENGAYDVVYNSDTGMIKVDGIDYFCLTNISTVELSDDAPGGVKIICGNGKTVLTTAKEDPIHTLELVYIGPEMTSYENRKIFPTSYRGRNIYGMANIKNIPAGEYYELTDPGFYRVKVEMQYTYIIEIREGAVEYNATEGAVLARVTDSEVVVDKDSWAFEAYNINDNNYFKLRDIAMAFTWCGSGNSFEVTWDADKNAINLITKTKYTPVGGECGSYDVASGTFAESSAPIQAAMPKEAFPTTSSIYVNGQPVALTAYNINGNNYFKLRDLAQVINFGVTWDGVNNCIFIGTESPYVY